MITDAIQFKTAAEIAEIVDQLVLETEATPCCHRRSEARFAVDLPSEVQPLSEDFKPVGPPFQARVRDISASGIRLSYQFHVNNKKFLAVVTQRPNGESVDLVVEVLWCERYGGYYNLGGRLVTAGEERRSELF